MDFPVLALLIALPAVGALFVAMLPARRTELVLPVALLVSVPPLAVAGYLLWNFETGVAGFQFTEQVLWYEPWGISWSVGVDGISILLVALTALLFPLSILASASITKNVKAYMVAMLRTTYDGFPSLVLQPFMAALASGVFVFVAFLTGSLLGLFTWGRRWKASWVRAFVIACLGGSVLAFGSLLGLTTTYADPQSGEVLEGLHWACALGGYFALVFGIANWPVPGAFRASR